MTYAVDEILSQDVSIANLVQDLKLVSSCYQVSRLDGKLTLVM